MPTRDPVDGLSLVVAENTRALRARARLTQREVAARAGMPQSTLSLLEGERRRVTVDDLLALCHGLDVPLARLLDGAPPEVLRRLGL